MGWLGAAGRVAGSGGAQLALDAAGNPVKASKWLETHAKGATPNPNLPCCRAALLRLRSVSLSMSCSLCAVEEVSLCFRHFDQ